MDQVYNFDKSLQQRLREYSDVLSGFEVLPASSLMKEWGFYTELTIDPNGWQAVWKISRATCDALKIPFPTIVLVFVLNVDFSSLHAIVRVLAVQDDIQVPEKQFVPLIQLWPTKAQDKTVALNISSTANVIDMLRFFYLHLFMPWDLEDDTADWKTKHLEPRLRLYYDMKNGTIPRAISDRVNSLFTEARCLQSRKESIEKELEDDEIDQDSNQKQVDMLTDIHLRLLEIKSEVEILENPLLRKPFIRRQICWKQESKEPRLWLIHNESLISNFITFLEQVRQLYPNDKATLQPNLSSTLENGGRNDCFILAEGTYDLNFGVFETGWTLKGISNRENTVLVSTNEDIMFDFNVMGALVENITINATVSQCAAVIRSGKVTFSNCKIFGDSTSTTHQGIIALAGSEIELNNCEIYGFCTAIVGNSGSKISMQNTEIYNAYCGMKIYDNSFLKLQKCTFRNCSDYGICVETENNLAGENHKVVDFDELNIIPEISTEFVSGQNNVKGNVVINHQSQITAIEDLFSVHDPTISQGASEEDIVTDSEMEEEINKTVLENVRSLSPATV